MITLLATAVVVLLIGWTTKTLTAKHRRHELRVLTDREITAALAPRPEPITTWPARNPADRHTHNPD